jgi:uncharacterized protein YndB with AHSA1/START domain
MNTTPVVPADEAVIAMTRVYEAPRDLVWEAMTEARHVAQWWGGPGFSNPVCEMDLRPGGLWRHVMRFPDGHELHMNFVFVEVDPPKRIAWRDVGRDQRTGGPPSCLITVTLEEMGARTRWNMVARFDSIAERDGALAMGFIRPIAASNDRLVDYLGSLETKRTRET